MLWTLTLTAQSQVFTWHLHATSTWLGTAWFSRLDQDFIPLGPPIHWCSKPWDPFFYLPLPFSFKGYWLFLLAFSFSLLFFFSIFFRPLFSSFFFLQALFFAAFSCFKNHFYDFSDYQITCLLVIILSRANIFNILKQQLQKTYALFKHSFRKQEALSPHQYN